MVSYGMTKASILIRFGYIVLFYFQLMASQGLCFVGFLGDIITIQAWLSNLLFCYFNFDLQLIQKVQLDEDTTLQSLVDTIQFDEWQLLPYIFLSFFIK